MEIRHKFSGYFQLPPEPFPFAEPSRKGWFSAWEQGFSTSLRGRKIPLSRTEQREDFPV